MIVDGFNTVLRVLVRGYAQVFEALHPLVGLALASAVIGLGMLWVVRRTSNQPAIARAKKRMQAHLLEMRLYRDEPGILLRAQGQLLLNNFRYVGHMLRPALYLALPMILLYGHLDAVYGRRPLRVGESALLAVETELLSSELTLQAAEGFLVDSVSVTSASDGQVAWRIRATEHGPSELRLQAPDGSVRKTVVAGQDREYLSASRTRSVWQRLLLSPGENGYATQSVASIHIAYPSDEIGIGGWDTHWAIWFVGISIATAFACKGYFGVTL